MKLIMENWRKYLIKESDKGLDDEGAPTPIYFGAVPKTLRMFFRSPLMVAYLKSLGLVFLKVNNIYKHSFAESGQEVGLTNRMLQTVPNSLYGNFTAEQFVKDVEDWFETVDRLDPKEELTDEIRERYLTDLRKSKGDIARVHNHKQDAGVPTFNGRTHVKLFLLDPGAEGESKLTFSDGPNYDSGALSADLVTIPQMEPGDIIEVKLRQPGIKLPMPTDVARSLSRATSPEQIQQVMQPFKRGVVVEKNPVIPATYPGAPGADSSR